jgi:hypothetical protein
MLRSIIALSLLLSACAVPFSGPSRNERKAECDRLAARAIQTTSLQEAKDLAAQASECYATAQRG